jgi:hypothetical protein
MLFKNSARTSKRTPHFTITKINWLTLFKFKPSHHPILQLPHKSDMKLDEVVAGKDGVSSFKVKCK